VVVDLWPRGRQQRGLVRSSAAPPPLLVSLVGRGDELKPLSECVAQGLRQRVDVPQDDVEGEGELLHVGADLRQLPGPFEDGHLDVQDGVLQHSGSYTLCLDIKDYLRYYILHLPESWGCRAPRI